MNEIIAREREARQILEHSCIALVHKGPYPALGGSYARILARVREKGLNVLLPTREIYLKGPGVIFRGNPKMYLTEIQLPLAH